MYARKKSSGTWNQKYMGKQQQKKNRHVHFGFINNLSLGPQYTVTNVTQCCVYNPVHTNIQK